MSAMSNKDRAYTPELRETIRVSIFEDSFDIKVQSHPGHLQDLSVGGCCVIMPRMKIQEEGFIFVKLTYAGRPMKTIYSRVVWVKPLEGSIKVGLQFKYISPDTQEVLNKLLSQFLS